MARKKDANKETYLDPYAHFRTKYENEFLKSSEVKVDDFIKVDPDPEEIKKEIDRQIQEAKKTKDKFVWEAMQYDPAFMVDPINDYYKKLIPEQVLEVLSDDELEEIIAYYDPVTWAHKNLFVRYGGFVPRVSKRGFPYQAQLIRTKSKRIVARAGRRVGKCGNSESIVQTMDGPMTFKELYLTRDNKPKILTMDQDTNDIYWTDDYTIEDNGIDYSYKLETRSGHIDIMTAEHPYYTIRDGMPEWVHIKDLKPGDRIAVLKKFPIIGKVYLGRNISRLLGYLIADGSTSQKNMVGFTNFDEEIINDLSIVVNNLGCALKIRDAERGQYAITGYDGVTNNVLNLVRKYKINSLAINKKIPKEIFKATREDIINFISAAWDCDGWASINSKTFDNEHKTPTFEVGYGSSSYDLLYGMKHLLLMLGIVSTAVKKKVKYNGKYRDTYQLTIHDINNFLKFYEQIPLIAKQNKLDDIYNLIQNKTRDNGKSYITQTPIGIVNEIEKRRQELGLRPRDLVLDPVNDRYRTDGRKYSIEKAKIYAKKLDAEKILQLIDNDMFWWDEVKSITPVGDKQSYAIEVPETQTFVANDTITHNTASIAVRVLHKAFTWKPSEKKGYYNIVIFTPNQTQINLIFKMFELLLEGNHDLLSMVGKENKDKGKIPTRKTPNYVLELTNGVTISGFVSGSTAIRGSAADMLVLDEASFLTTEDTDSVVALINEHPNVELWVSSTPAGPKDYFYDRVNDPTFVSFHFPTDKYHPEWSHQMEQDFKRQLTISGFKHEVLAEFSDDGETVFQAEFVENALRDYEIKHEKRKENWIYSIGIDWNDPENGTQICVIGYDIENKRYKLVDKDSVHIAGWTQTKAVERVAQMTEKWRPDSIYSDKGHGAAQIERLHELGLLSPPNSPSRLLLKAKAIDFGSSIEVKDPWTQEKRKVQTKSYMVNNAVRVFENGFIEIPKNELMLINQLRGYNIDRINPLTGTPVYKADPKYGDHELDALMLALFAFHVEYSTLTKFIPTQAVNTMNIVNIPTFITALNSGRPKNSIELEMERDKQLEREEYEQAHGILSDKSTTLTMRQNTPILSAAIKRSSLVSRRRGITRRRL